MRPGADWCTLCYADLRPAPPAPVAVPTPAPVAVAPALVSVGAGRDLDPLTAALHDLVADDEISTGQAAERPTWPCRFCGGRNDMDADHCGECQRGFGDMLDATPKPTLDRRRRNIRAALALLAMLAVLALVTWATTKRPPGDGGPNPVTPADAPANPGGDAPADPGSGGTGIS